MRNSQTDGEDDGEGQKGRQEMLTGKALWGDSRRLPPFGHAEFFTLEPFNSHKGVRAICFGGGGSKKAPPPAQPTRFEYGPADYSNTQQQKAAILQDQAGGSSQSSFGSELGTGGSATTATSSNPNG